MKFSRILGGVLLISGTTIGAGMLALPTMASFAGFIPSLILFTICWAAMLASALFLDVNLHVKGEPNFISMSGRMLGFWGKGVSWVFYLLLLYALLAAYIAGSTPLFIDAIAYLTGYTIPTRLAFFSLPVIFGAFVYLGTHGVDLVNRLLMLFLIISYTLLIAFVPSYIETSNLLHYDWSKFLLPLTVVLTSFGYHIVIPSLTTYLEHDAKALRITIIVGSAIPLIIYFSWLWLTLGAVPADKLQEAYFLGQAATEPLAQVMKLPFISIAARFFSFFAIITSFLGVSLSLADFLTDGFKIKKSWEGRLMACGLTFIPPLVFVFTYERGFYLALQYAGVFVAILLIFLPAAMAWKLKSPFYRSILGRTLLLLIMFFALSVICLS